MMGGGIGTSEGTERESSRSGGGCAQVDRKVEVSERSHHKKGQTGQGGCPVCVGEKKRTQHEC